MPSTSIGPVGSAWVRPPVLAALGIVLLMTSCLAIASLNRLDHVYSWDQLWYHEKAVRLSHEFRSSLILPWRGVANSVRHNEYNDLAAIPLAAWVSVFGEHRQVFVLGILVLYAVPASVLFVILMATALRRFCGRSPTTWLLVGWLFIPWLIGAFWTPTLLGRVGVGGLGLIFAAAALHVRRPVEVKDWWEPVVIAGLLAAAILCRRWFIFAVIGILVAIVAETLLAVVRQQRSANRLLVAAKPILGLLTMAAVLVALSMPVISQFQLADLTDVYAAYHHPGSFMYLWGNPWSVAQRLGLPSLLVILAASIAGAFHREWRGFLAAALTVGAVSLGLFSRVQAPGVHHALIWVGVACVLLGIGLSQVSTLPRTKSWLAVGTSVVMLSTSVAAVLFLGRAGDLGSRSPWWNRLAPSLTVGGFLPKNLDIVLATVEFLDTNIPAGSSIAFLSSGLSLNDDVLRKIRLSLPECDVSTRYRIRKSRLLSRRGRFPGFILQSDYVVVIGPAALGQESQGERVRIPAEWLFQDASPLVECFELVAGPAVLPDGRTISAHRLRVGMKARARTIIADELNALFHDHCAFDLSS